MTAENTKNKRLTLFADSAIYSLALALVVVTASTTAFAAGAAHEGAHAAHPTMLQSLLFPVLNFALYLFLMSVVIRKVALPNIAKRKEKIAGEIVTSERRLADAEHERTFLKKQLADVDVEKVRIVKDLEAEGRKMAEAVISAGNRNAERALKDVSRIARGEKVRAEEEVRAAILKKASGLARDKIRAQLSVEQDRRMREEALARLLGA
ncbi:MAG: ATP synthase F0 subunit B [bacterium]|nr:ATP synthase F0 subunit B [bacterium]